MAGMTGADAVNKQRRDLVDTISAKLHDLKQGFMEGREGCNMPCRAMHIGVLTQALYGLKLLDHVPGNGLQGFSLSNLIKKIEAIKCPEWCDKSSAESFSGRHRAHKCPIKSSSEYDHGSEAYYIAAMPGATHLLKETGALISRVKGKMGGLRLADFVSSAPESK